MKHTFVVSDESVNSYGLIVKTDGIDTTRFLKNPIMLYGHDVNNVIGYWENIRLNGAVMYADAVFDMDNQLGADVARKVEQGFLKATSLGIDVLEKDNEFIYKSELHEISIVPIGANSNTLKMYNKPELLQLNFKLKLNNVDLLQSIIALLGLDPKATEQDVLKEVETLLGVKKEQEGQQEQKVQQELKLALDAGKINHSTLPQFTKLLREDFKSAKVILDAMPERTSIYAQIQNLKAGKPSISSYEENQAGKPKTQWNLEDYRRFAPNELRNNPNLYNDLVEAYKKESGKVLIERTKV